MNIKKTDLWMCKHPDPVDLCTLIKPYFKNSGHTPEEIHAHFVRHGMYRQPLKGEAHQAYIQALQKNQVWDIVAETAAQLQAQWEGPEIPIFIFLADPENTTLKKAFNGKGGIAFPDKIILFVSKQTSPEEIRALLMHEYNHVVRLNKIAKDEARFSLLDSIIMEGLAENSVREYYGEKATAAWTRKYSETALENLYHKLIQPALHLPKSSRKHQKILYGHKPYPDMAGYCTGYYLVKKYMKQTEQSMKDIIGESAEIFLPEVENSHPFTHFFKKK